MVDMDVRMVSVACRDGPSEDTDTIRRDLLHDDVMSMDVMSMDVRTDQYILLMGAVPCPERP